MVSGEWVKAPVIIEGIFPLINMTTGIALGYIRDGAP